MSKQQDGLKVSVSAEALRQVLSALVGPSHHIRELQVSLGHPLFGADNPIQKLVDEYNEWAKHNTALLPTE